MTTASNDVVNDRKGGISGSIGQDLRNGLLWQSI